MNTRRELSPTCLRSFQNNVHDGPESVFTIIRNPCSPSGCLASGNRCRHKTSIDRSPSGARYLANLSALSDEQIIAIRAVLWGEQVGPLADRFEAITSRMHGPVRAVRVAMYRLGFAALLAARPSRQRDLVCAMVAARHLSRGGLVLYDLSSSSDRLVITNQPRGPGYVPMK